MFPYGNILHFLGDDGLHDIKAIYIIYYCIYDDVGKYNII